MFGNRRVRNITISLILLAFCSYILLLFFQNNINLYIHPRYTVFTVIMCVLAIILLTVGIVYEYKKPPSIINNVKKLKIKPVNVLVVLVLLLAFTLPAQALSSQAIGRKSVNTPQYDSRGSSNKSINTSCPDVRPDSIESWVTAIGQSPLHCFQDESINLTGFVVDSATNPLPSDMYYVGRVVVSCCVIDAQPYALPIKTHGFGKHPNGTWLKVTGTLQSADVNGVIQIVVEPDNVSITDGAPVPYEFLNTSP